MKDSRFKELLNLYLDHQIAPADAAELEAEILANPARRRTYQSYCRLQRGCTTLFDQRCQEAPASYALARSLKDAERKLAISGARPARPWWWAYAAAATMAACVALVLVRMPSGTFKTEVADPLADASLTENSSVAPAWVADNRTVITLPVPSTRALYHPAMVLAHLPEETTAISELRPASLQVSAEDLADWSARARVESAHFESRSVEDAAVSGFRTRPFNSNGYRAEMTSYQFQR